MIDPTILCGRKATPLEWKIVLVLFSVGFIGLGLAALVIALQAPPERHAQSAYLAYRGLACLAAGTVPLIGYWLSRRWRP